MCLLTYIPKPYGGFILSSNRDEHIGRPVAVPPQKYFINGQPVFYPKDPQAGGTWIGGNREYMLCLLNGGFEKHESKPPYRQSRGKIIPDFFAYSGLEKFISEYDFTDIEPFTLVVINTAGATSIDEIVWNGSDIFRQSICKDKPHLWSSATLYSPQIINERKKWFAYFLQQHQNPSNDDVLHFHQFGGIGDRTNDLKMNRNNEILTVSTTQFEIAKSSFAIRYFDFLKDKNLSYQIL